MHTRLVPVSINIKLLLLIALILIFSFLKIDNYVYCEQRVTFSAVGDVLLDRGVRSWIEKEGVDYPFDNFAEYLRKRDIAFCNLECPVSSRGAPLDKLYTFRADNIFLIALKNSGFDIISLANNHTLDYGREALLETMYEIKRSGLFKVGAGKNRIGASLPLLIKRNGIRFAFFASNQIRTQGIEQDPHKPGSWDASAEDIVKVVQIVRPFVDYVVVSLHWGVEYSNKPLERQIREAHSIIEAGADLIIGHHTHSIMGVEIYRKRLILYSLGNFLFDQHQPPGNMGIIFECVFTSSGIKEAALIPVITRKYRPNFMTGEEYIEAKEGIESDSSQFEIRLIDKNGRLFIKSQSQSKGIKQFINTSVRN